MRGVDNYSRYCCFVGFEAGVNIVMSGCKESEITFGECRAASLPHH